MYGMWMLSIWLACGARRAPERTPKELAVEALDEAYAKRTDPEALESSIQASLDLLSSDPTDPDYLSRTARAFSARAITRKARPDKLSDLETARSYGLLCLAGNTGYSVRIEQAGGQILGAATKQLQNRDVPCIEQTLIAWVRWMELRGPAGLVDAKAVRYLAERLIVLEPEGWVGTWAKAMVLSLPQAQARAPLERSERLFAQAIQAQPRLAEIHLDYIKFQLSEVGETQVDAALAAFPSQHPSSADGPWALENRVARAEAEATSSQALMQRVWSAPR
ncbi:MAG: hypothetical protein ACI9VR_001327 [Cognaticolwellia sp.]|jgi:hypothetical protein